MTALHAKPDFIDDHDNGLIRLWSSRADEPRIAQLMGSAFRAGADEPFNR